MTVKDLKDLLKDADDDMLVLMPVDNGVFDGYFQHPCVGESGVVDLGMDENLGLSEKSFVIVPHGFFESEEHDIREKN